ncbi:Spindle pole body protein, contains UNC-84 domain [Phaffia rhodozyma]|uniref:Spindle pole body protein, contains UNC-84 domain n=1 Tax=Phaffia rhodozyma TaxID=264483 RepID=A0A0F7SVW9_PHARH|nr:Spindle pole body protein, contains UNC-84 domain [Phaffia rhodozyma]
MSDLRTTRPAQASVQALPGISKRSRLPSPVIKSSYGAPPDLASIRRIERHSSPSIPVAARDSRPSRRSVSFISKTAQTEEEEERGGSEDTEMTESEANFELIPKGLESAKARYARLKQRNHNIQGHTKIHESTLNNTSVNIATAFHQASNSDNPFVKSGSFVTSGLDSNHQQPRVETQLASSETRPASTHKTMANSQFQPNTSLSSSYRSSSSSRRRTSPMPPSSLTEPQMAIPNRERTKSPVLEAVAGAARALSPVSYLLKPRVGGQLDSFIDERDLNENDESSRGFLSFSTAAVSPSRKKTADRSDFDRTFLSATTQSAMDSSMSFDRSNESSYRFEEEERLLQEMEQKKGRSNAVNGVYNTRDLNASNGGWYSGLGGYDRGTSEVSSVNYLSSMKGRSPMSISGAAYRPPIETDIVLENEYESSGTDLEDPNEDDPNKSTKSTRRRRPRVSKDNMAFKYQAGGSGSDEYSDSEEKHKRRRKKGEATSTGATGMIPIVEKSRRKGTKKSTKETTGSTNTRKELIVFADEEEMEARNDDSLSSGRSIQAPTGYDDDSREEEDHYPGFLRRQEEDNQFVKRVGSRDSHLQDSTASASSRSRTPSRQILPHLTQDVPPVGLMSTLKKLPLHIIRSVLVATIFLCNMVFTALSWVLSRPGQLLRDMRVNSTMLDWKKLAPFLWGAFGLLSAAYLAGSGSIESSSPSLPSSPSSSWLPFLSPRQPSYDVPSVPPESLEEVINRLASLESALGSLSTRTQTQGNDLSTRFATADDRLSSDVHRAFEIVHKNQEDSKTRFHTLDSIVGRLRSDVQTLNVRMVTGEETVTSLDAQINGVTKELRSLDEKVKKAEQLAKNASNAAKVAQLAADSIEAQLPARLFIRMNPKTKSLDIDPVFWKALRAVFVDRKEASLLGKSQPSASKDQPVPTPNPQIPSWDDFLSHNEDALRSWTDSEFDQKAQSGVIVSRVDFLDLLKRELEALKFGLESQFDDQTRSMGDEVLAKSLSAIKVASDDQASRPSSRSPASEDTSAISTIVTSMIDSALLKYSKDVLAMTDYALESAGGRIIPSLTSKTYEIKPSGWGTVFGRKPIQGRPPITVLNPNINVGYCWPFVGSVGQLGISLARPVIVSGVTIEHAAREVSFDLAAAPREIEIYGLPDGESDRAKVQEHNARRAGSETESDEALSQVTNYFLLGSFTYDIEATNHIQTFSIPEDIQSLEIKTGILIARVKSNYGDDYTCLYRIRIHGSQ